MPVRYWNILICADYSADCWTVSTWTRADAGLGSVFVLKVDRACRYDGGNGVFVNHLGYGSVSQENNVLIERLNLTLQFDTVN